MRPTPLLYDDTVEIYDLLGRVGCVQDNVPTINATGACTSGTNPYVQNTYDKNELGIQGTTDFPTGRLTQTVATTYYPDSGNPTVTTTEKMQYDARGRLTDEHLALDLPTSLWHITASMPNNYQMALAYNDANQLVGTQTSTNPTGAGYTTTQLYDSYSGTLTGLSDQQNATQPDLASLSFNSNALLGSINFLTSGTSPQPLAQESMSYDGDLRPVEANAQWQSGSGTSGQLFDQQRAYDPAGNVMTLITTQAQVNGNGGGSETQNFCDDSQNRLVWAGNSGTQPPANAGTCGTATLANTLNGASYNNSYSYTHLDQFTQAPFNGSGSYQYLYCNASAPHQLTGIYAANATCTSKSGQQEALSYDAWGNAVTRTLGSGGSADTATLSYDLLNHFVEWDDTTPGNASQAWYAYDSNGSRVLQRATSGGSTSITIYAFGLEEHAYDGSGNPTGNTYYYSLGGRLIGELTNTGTSLLVTDALGSVLASFSNVAGSAAVQSNRVYDPYGTQRYKVGNFATTKGFTGQYHDPTTGLDYYGARYYDPKAAIFLSADSVQGNLQGMNPYAYVGTNPETMTDPTGKMMCSDTCHGGGGSDPTPPPSPPSTPTNGTSGNYYQSTDYKLEVAKTVLFRIKFIIAMSRLSVNGLIFKNGPAEVADFCGAFSLCLPMSDSQDIWAKVLGFFGISDSNKGAMQAALTYKNGDIGGFLPFFEGVADFANGVGLAYYAADLYLSIKHGNTLSAIADGLNMGATVAYFLYRMLKKPQLLTTSIILAIGGVFMTAIAIQASGVDPGAPIGNNRGRNRSIGGGGGGFGGFPPFIPALSFFPPQPNEENPIGNAMDSF